MFDYRILPDQRLILIWNRGKISVESCIQEILTIRADPDNGQNFDVISDASGIETDLSTQEIQKIIQFLALLPREEVAPKNAIIAPTDRIYAISRMFEQLSEGFSPIKTGVFRDWASALSWLERDPAPFVEYLQTHALPLDQMTF